MSENWKLAAGFILLVGSIIAACVAMYAAWQSRLSSQSSHAKDFLLAKITALSSAHLQLQQINFHAITLEIQQLLETEANKSTAGATATAPVFDVHTKMNCIILPVSHFLTDQRQKAIENSIAESNIETSRVIQKPNEYSTSGYFQEILIPLEKSRSRTSVEIQHEMESAVCAFRKLGGLK